MTKHKWELFCSLMLIILLEGTEYRSEVRNQRTEDRGQGTEDRGQRTEDRGQRTEDRGQRTEDRGQGRTPIRSVCLAGHGNPTYALHAPTLSRRRSSRYCPPREQSKSRDAPARSLSA